MTTMIARAAALAALACTLAPAPAFADFLVAPYFAWSRNRDTERWVAGGGATAEVTVGWFVAGGDVGYGSGFFDPAEDVLDLIASSHVLTFTGHAGVIRKAPDDDARVLPYATAGFGWMRQEARDREGLLSVTRNDPSFHFGGGVNLMVNEYLGVRADVRNFRSLRDPFESPDPIVADLERVSFWRFALGAVLRFGTN
jgi:opacity protein-like surface antigen